MVRVSESAAAHGERMLPLLGEAFAESGWARSSLDRIAVGVGPGSFTGIRVGVALGSGIGTGLGRPVIGVGSLRAMCRAVPPDRRGPRCALVDARRDEVFAAVFDETGAELVAPRTLARSGLEAWLSSLPARPGWVLGEVLGELGPVAGAFRSELTDLPHAVAVAWAAEALDESTSPPVAAYVRPADAALPKVPQSRLSSGDSR